MSGAKTGGYGQGVARIAINPDVLTWALLDSERTVADLEGATSRPRQVIDQWIAGTSKPHLGDLRKIAALLGRSPHFFALPEPPEGRTYSGRFRTAIAGNVDPYERAIEIAALRWAQRQQDLGKSLLSADDFSKPFATDREAEAVASDARTWLQWETKTQVDAASKSGAFKKLRVAVEHQQIIVTLRSAATTRFCGFSLPDSLLPVIYINKDYELGSVRSFTLMHELGHILHAQRRVCYGGDAGVERWCNQFAAAFLMPAGDVTQYFKKVNLEFSSPSDTDPVRRVANRFKTSWLAAAIRLEELQLAPDGIADFVRTGKPEPKEKGYNPQGGRKTPELRVDEFGSTYVRIISAALDSGKIPDLDARRILRVDGREELSETRAIAESEWRLTRVRP